MGGEAPEREVPGESAADDESAPSFDRSRVAWWLVGIVLGVAMAFVVVSFVGTFALGLFMYYATRPVYDRLEGRLRYPSLTAAAALLAVAVPAVLLVAYAVAVSALEVAAVAGESFAGYESLLRPYPDLSSFAVRPEELLELARENQDEFRRLGGPELVGSVAGALAAVGNALLQLFVALAFAFYLLRDDDRLVGWSAGIVGEESVTRKYATAVDDTLRTVYFGSILQAFAVTIVSAVLYNLADLLAPAGISVPVPTLLGVLTGVASLVPVVGIKLVYLPVAAYLAGDALTGGVGPLWFPVAFAVAFALVVDLATKSVVRPYLAGRNTHVGLLLFAVVLGVVLFGWYGLFLGPLLLVLLVQFAAVVLPELVGGEHSSIPLPTPADESDESAGESSDVESIEPAERAEHADTVGESAGSPEMETERETETEPEERTGESEPAEEHTDESESVEDQTNESELGPDSSADSVSNSSDDAVPDLVERVHRPDDENDRDGSTT